MDARFARQMWVYLSVMAEGFGGMAKLSGARLISQLAKRGANLEASILALATGRHGFGDGLWLEVTTRRLAAT